MKNLIARLSNQVKLHMLFTLDFCHFYCNTQNMNVIIFILCFACLFLLSRVLTITLTDLLYRVTKNHVMSIQLLAAFLLPGVIIHELAHWFVASILFVPTGEIEFFPQVQGGSVKLGSVQIAKTDPVRRFFIGIAPVLGGLGVIGGVYWLLHPSLIAITFTSALFCYVIFEIGNTMFASRKDLEGVIGFVVLLALSLLLLLFLRVHLEQVFFSFMEIPQVQRFFSQLTIFLLVAIGLDILFIALLKGLLWLFSKPKVWR